ncbi:MAG: Release factor glutamine methyltransferase [Betaproteobacteria bacterium ADurb.Bin341]|nr:MAG: Release factor glutamine methyltransferase [Betaproteobacteria bacterium ADurb.Bin341]
MRGEGKTVAGFLALARGKIDRLDARLLLQDISGLTHTRLIAEPQTALSPERWQTLASLLERRAAGEPLAYLLGHTEFRGRRFIVTPDVLIPRPETEELVELALEKFPLPACGHPLPFAGEGNTLPFSPFPLPRSMPPRCVDLGTGSGIIAISLKLECPQAEMQAVDASSTALAVAQENARQLGADIAFHHGSWFEPLAGQTFDLIVANPPYVAAGDPHLQLNGLPHEPQTALVAGADGLDCLRTIIADAPAHLNPGGWLLFEHGHDQGDAARHLLTAAGFEAVFTQTDLAGLDRISGGLKK